MSEYVTADLQIASYLAALGHEPKRVEGAAPRRYFVFAASAADDVASYFQGTRALAPQALFQSYRQMKRFLFAPPSSLR